MKSPIDQQTTPFYAPNMTGGDIADMVRLTSMEAKSLAGCAMDGGEPPAGAVRQASVRQRLLALGLVHPLFWFDDEGALMHFSFQRTPAGETLNSHFTKEQMGHG